jgi:hypothetical protein
MLLTKIPLGFIPIGTKIYLKNKELIEVENLKFGDEILSISILNENLKSPIDVYNEYLNTKKEIAIEQLQISSSYITDIRYVGYSNNNIISIDNLGHIEQGQLFLVMHKHEDKNIIITKNKEGLDPNFEINSQYVVSLEKDIKTDTKDFFIFSNKINSISLIDNKIPLFSMSLSNSNFYVTENMILLGRNI